MTDQRGVRVQCCKNQTNIFLFCVHTIFQSFVVHPPVPMWTSRSFFQLLHDEMYFPEVSVLFALKPLLFEQPNEVSLVWNYSMLNRKCLKKKIEIKRNGVGFVLVCKRLSQQLLVNKMHY
ncbi:hypothetical protein CRENBAI_000609 [Crenichthys baileyi]|uniref:Uncharacterized protein n=1 Tax=Crenichthys baileyi TaxID=28760 RepID=A0AAV9RZ41_9TELE